jgi:hypothetical protein
MTLHKRPNHDQESVPLQKRFKEALDCNTFTLALEYST